MNKQKKEFNSKLYGVVAFILVAALLATITVITYKNKYNAFYPEKVATAFAETIVNRGDGYNAYKNTIMSKNYKYGDYIREYYMYPLIYSEFDYTPGDDTGSLKGYNDESYMSDKTKNDTGKLAGQVIDEMYPYYVQLIEENNGWDNYHVIFTEYFKKLCEIRENIFGDKYMTDEIMFTALEANVSTYGDSLMGTDEIIDENTNLKTSEKTIGIYENAYGEDYKVTYDITSVQAIDNINNYKSSLDKKALDTYKITVEDISEATNVTVQIKINGKTVIEDFEITVVKIKDSWYVDNISTDTAELYDFYK